jgi:tetratricopeptide (TPR) repeat protein
VTISDGEFRIHSAERLAENSAKVLQEAGPFLKEDSAKGALARGKVFELTKHHESAVASYREAIDKDPGSREALARLVVAQLQAGQHEAALNTAVKHAAVGDQFIIESLCEREQYSPMTILAEALLLNDRSESAVDAYEKALQINPKDSFSAGRLAYLYLIKDDVQNALGVEAAMKDSPRYRNLRSLLKLARNNPSTLPSITLHSLTAMALSRPAGRPIVVNGEIRLATLHEGDTWCSKSPLSDANLSQTANTAAAQAWLEAGRGEHASVASFARFVLQLMGLGAPPNLVRDAIQAMADEVDHACDSFGIASQLTGKPFSPGVLDVSDIISDLGDSRSILRDAIVEGCVAETISARQAVVAHERSQDPSVRTALAQIAEEETKHAELAWRFVEWLIEKQPMLANELEILPEIEKAYATSDIKTQDDQVMEVFGILSDGTKQAIINLTFETIIRPRMAHLVGRVPKVNQSAEFATPPDKAWLSANGLDRIPA